MLSGDFDMDNLYHSETRIICCVAGKGDCLQARKFNPELLMDTASGSCHELEPRTQNGSPYRNVEKANFGW
jgi:hypothetical protein